MTKWITLLDNSRIATVKKWVYGEQRGENRTEMIVSEVSILSILPKNFPFGFDRVTNQYISIICSISSQYTTTKTYIILTFLLYSSFHMFLFQLEFGETLRGKCDHVKVLQDLSIPQLFHPNLRIIMKKNIRLFRYKRYDGFCNLGSIVSINEHYIRVYNAYLF